jgi:predicted HicB family RNase H-like nuclease
MARKPTPIIDDEDIDLDAEVIHVNGRRLTNELAEHMAIEAERTSRERSNANLIPGRKSLSGGRKHSPIVQVRVSITTRDKLAEIAKSQGVSVSKLSRRVLDEFVTKHH